MLTRGLARMRYLEIPRWRRTVVNTSTRILVLTAVIAGGVCSAEKTATRDWQTGTLLSTEQSRELDGSTTTTQADGTVKKKGNKSELSGNETSNTTQNYEIYQTYTIRCEDRIYTAREHLLFPWSKPADITVGGPVKLAIQKNKLVLLDESNKEHKTSIVKKAMATQ